MGQRGYSRLLFLREPCIYGLASDTSVLYVEHLVFIIKILSGGYDACLLGQILNPFSFETAVFVVASFRVSVVFTRRSIALYLPGASYRDSVHFTLFLSLLLLCVSLIFLLPFLFLSYSVSGICSEALFLYLELNCATVLHLNLLSILHTTDRAKSARTLVSSHLLSPLNKCSSFRVHCLGLEWSFSHELCCCPSLGSALPFFLHSVRVTLNTLSLKLTHRIDLDASYPRLLFLVEETDIILKGLEHPFFFSWVFASLTISWMINSNYFFLKLWTLWNCFQPTFLLLYSVYL